MAPFAPKQQSNAPNPSHTMRRLFASDHRLAEVLAFSALIFVAALTCLH